MSDLPDLYFRVRDNGAAVFRLSSENRDRRLELEQVAVVNTNRGDIKAVGDNLLTTAERDKMNDWLAARMSLLAQRELDSIARTVDQIQHTAHWAISKAEDHALEEVTEPLLLAMHDLRAILVRKKSERLAPKE